MSKFVIIGDVHGRTQWKKIVEDNPDADKFIFLGDYVSSHDGISGTQQIDNCIAILEFKEDNPDKVVLLRGNHDIQHLGYSWAECCGFDREVYDWMANGDVKREFLDDTQWVYVYNDIVFSHAGITKRWFEDSGCKKVEDINNLEPSELFGFRPCKFSDYYGISKTQGPTWVRLLTLAEHALPGYTYVVGHTTVKRITNIKDLADPEEFPNCPNIWACDCMPNEYLVYENNEFKVKKI